MTKIAELRKELIELDKRLNVDNDIISDTESPREYIAVRSSSVKSPQVKSPHNIQKDNPKTSIDSKKVKSKQNNNYYKKYTASQSRINELEVELKNEKYKNKVLQKQVKEYQSKPVISEQTLAQIKKLQDDYEVLVKSFNCSEEIRKKQQKIIKRLTSQASKSKPRPKG